MAGGYARTLVVLERNDEPPGGAAASSATTTEHLALADAWREASA
jgi:hypothetical protein